MTIIIYGGLNKILCLSLSTINTILQIIHRGYIKHE